MKVQVKLILVVVAGLFALACMVLSGCGGRAKPSTPEEKRFAESARAGIQSVCDMEKPPKECADELMREVLAETNAVKRQRLLSFVYDAMKNARYSDNLDRHTDSWEDMRAFRTASSDILCAHEEYGAALELWFAQMDSLRNDSPFCKAEAKRYKEIARTATEGDARGDANYMAAQWDFFAEQCLSFHRQGLSLDVLWDISVAGRYCEGKSEWDKWRVAKRIKDVIGRYPDWYLEDRKKRAGGKAERRN